MPFDWAIVLCSSWLIVGLFLDGWAHLHVPGLESFFTPWHAVLYSGLLVTTLYLLINFLTRLRQGAAWKRALPRGYLASLAGAGIFAASGFVDMIWHEIFGIEESIDALLSPSHLGLALGFLLILSGPLRAARHRLKAEQAPSWRTHFPLVLSMALILSVLGFFTQYAHPLVQPAAAQSLAVIGGSEAELYLAPLSGNSHTRMRLPNVQGPAQPDWSPDGERLAFSASQSTRVLFTSRREGNVDLFLAPVTGTTVATRITEHPGLDHFPAWLPDGNSITFSSSREGTDDIFLMELDRGRLTNVTLSPGLTERQARVSPDGESLAYIALPARPAGGVFFSPDELNQGLGIVGIILQTTLLMGGALYLLRHWRLPFGALTVLFSVNALLFTLLGDNYWLLPGAVLTGLAADILVKWSTEGSEPRPVLGLLAFTAPILYYLGYFTALAWTHGVGWPIELWLGSTVLAGISGWLLHFVMGPASPALATAVT